MVLITILRSYSARKFLLEWSPVKLWEKIKMTKFSPKGFFLAHGTPKIVIRDLDFGGGGGVGIFNFFFLIFFLTRGGKLGVA
jgi:hypothetical protein